MTECDICCESQKRVHTCGRCTHKICRTCARRVACDKENPLFDLHVACVQCHRRFPIEECHFLLGISFMNGTWRKIRQERLYQHQLRWFTNTHPLVAHLKRIRQTRDEFSKVSQLIRTGRQDLIPERTRLARLARQLGAGPQTAGQGDVAPGRGGVSAMRCARPECEGHVTLRGTCLLCEQKTCLRCGAAAHDGVRPCDPRMVASVNLINENCRPCVRCAAPSLRAEGCAVMWCVNCHTFWNWDSRTVISTSRNVPHNPDHREWLHATGGNNPHREIGDVPCGGLPTIEELHLAFLRDLETFHDVSIFTEYILNSVDGVYRTQDLRALYPLTWDEEQLTESLRVSFLIGDIGLSTFRHRLDMRYRTAEYKREVGEVLMGFVFSAADVFQRFCSVRACLPSQDVAISLSVLRQIMNDGMAKVSVKYRRAVPFLSEGWAWETRRSAR